MSFQEKSAIAITGSLVLVYGAYFAIVGRWLTVAPLTEITLRAERAGGYVLATRS